MHPLHKHVPLDEALTAPPCDAASDSPPGRTALPIIAVEVLGPDEINVGGVASYTVIVANLGEAAVERVQIQVALPPDAATGQIQPPPLGRQDGGLCFDLGRLAPRSRQRIQIELLAQERGRIELRAEAIFTATAHTATKICQPELAMTASGPAAVVVGDAATFKVVIENRGDGPADDVTVAQRTADAAQAIAGAAHVGRLAPGESREIYLSAVTQEAGWFVAQFVATAWGGIAVEAEAQVRVARPMLALEAHGPRVCTVQSAEVFTIVLANPGDAPASNVEAVAAVPASVQLVAFDRPVQFDAARRIVRWRVPTLPPGSRETLRLKAMAVEADRFALQVASAADYGLRAECEHLCEAAAFSRRVA